jgi:prefoldin subunit 5
MSIFELELLLEAVQRKQKELQQTMNKLSEEIQKLIAILQQLPKAEQSRQASKPTSAESLLN